ncbi:hypothetical protein JG687_00016147 [Phytophthora cactorum]|uniref:Uncharacterized protein n=1 Tax=Phytophthora cactorum TaxID=29920 RepID=A0A8T1TU22_9STRA|nr:hypothetical protein JG687_00016147 [Phytophthora cactorum]
MGLLSATLSGTLCSQYQFAFLKQMPMSTGATEKWIERGGSLITQSCACTCRISCCVPLL